MRAALYALIFSTLLSAQPPGPRMALSTVRASGQASITVKPDMARIQIGVTTEAPTAAAAASQNAAKVTAVIAQMKKLAGPQGEIETTNYSLYPQHRPVRDAATPPQISGYTANNTVQVTVYDLNLVPKVIDSATRTGANTIHGLHFTVKDEAAARAQALKPAASRARSNAEALAAAMGLRVVRVLSVDEGEPARIIPLQRMEMAQSARLSAPTPVEPGNIEMHATVSVTLEVAAQ